MLEWIRKKLPGIVIWTVIGAITLVFLLGTGDFLLNRNFNNKIAAKINGEIISVDTVNNIYNEQVKHHYAMQKSHSSLDLDPQKIKSQITNELVNRAAIITGLQNAGFIINNEYLAQVIKSNPMFQDNGKFSTEKYTSFFKQASITESEYHKFLSGQLLIDQLRTTLLLSGFTPETDVNNFINTWNQSRDFGFVVVPFQKFVNQQNSKQEINEQEIENYYNSHQEAYIKPEKIKINYIEISATKLLDQITIEPTELTKYYEEHLDYYTLPELVNVKHILILAPKDSPQEKSGEARSKIEDLLAKLKLGKSFANLAKEFSEDQGTAVNGGDLGWIGKGETDLNFEQAAFSLKKQGELSGIIQSNFGYHIIQLVDKREAKVKNFEEVLSQVTENYKEELAQIKLQNIVEELSNNTLENEDLYNIANKLNLSVQTIGPFTSLGETSGILSHNEVIMAAFDQKNLNKNSDLIKLADDRFIILKAIEQTAASKKTFAEAYNEIKQTLQVSAAKNQAEEQGLTLAKELINSTHPNKLAKSYGLEWNLIDKATRNTQAINPEILKAAFSLPKPKMQKAFTLSNGDFIIVQLLNIHANLNEKQQPENQQVSTQLTMFQAQIEQQLYEKDLIKSAKIKIFKD